MLLQNAQHECAITKKTDELRLSALSSAITEKVDNIPARLRSSVASVAIIETRTSPAIQGKNLVEHHKSCYSRHLVVEDLKDMPNTFTKEIVSNV